MIPYRITITMLICVATKKLIETQEGVHLAFSGGANLKNGGAARGLDRATSRVQLLEITWRGDFFVWIESLSGSDASLHFFALVRFCGEK